MLVRGPGPAITEPSRTHLLGTGGHTVTYHYIRVKPSVCDNRGDLRDLGD